MEARTQQQFRQDGLYGPINAVAGTMGGYGEADTQAGLRNQGFYGPLNKAIGTQNPKAQYWNRGNVAGLGEVNTQQGLRNQGFYGPLNKAIGTQNPKAQYWNRGNIADFDTKLYANLYGPHNTDAPTAKYWNRGNVAGLAGYLGDAATKTVPGLVVAAVLVGAYFLFFKKGDAAQEVSAPEEAMEEEVPADAEGFSFYY